MADVVVAKSVAEKRRLGLGQLEASADFREWSSPPIFCAVQLGSGHQPQQGCSWDFGEATRGSM